MQQIREPVLMFYAFDLTDTPVGWAMVQMLGQDDVSLIAYLVHEPFRRKGYGRQLIADLQSRFKRIETECMEKTKNAVGNKTCRKMGFVPYSCGKEGVYKMVWKKEENDEAK